MQESPEEVISLIPEAEPEANMEGDNTVATVSTDSMDSHQAEPASTSTPVELGPPQPSQPLDADEPSEMPLLEQELYRLRAECMASQKAIEESKRVNS